MSTTLISQHVLNQLRNDYITVNGREPHPPVVQVSVQERKGPYDQSMLLGGDRSGGPLSRVPVLPHVSTFSKLWYSYLIEGATLCDGMYTYRQNDRNWLVLP